MADKISVINLKVNGAGRKYKFENTKLRPLRITASINGIETMVKMFLSEEEAYEYVCWLLDWIEIWIDMMTE